MTAATSPTFIPQELIRKKRNGAELTDNEIAWFVDGITNGTLTDAQIAAWAMAIYFQGLSTHEGAALTRAMTHSGTLLDWSYLGRPTIEKHSTGGVGDKVSLILAPIVAACGGAGPMVAGRGLGHTGGTLDKLDAIPGYQTQPSLEQFQAAVAQAGCAICGQTADLAPADRRLYALRDATGSVESIPLIVASVLSKKLAAGAQALVLDVKVGSGAFMDNRENAFELANRLVEVARANELKCSALLSDMDQVLGRTAGNAVEVFETIDVLTGNNPESRLLELTLTLAAEMLELGGLAANNDDAIRQVQTALDSGKAAEHFSRSTFDQPPNAPGM